MDTDFVYMLDREKIRESDRRSEKIGKSLEKVRSSPDSLRGKDGLEHYLMTNLLKKGSDRVYAEHKAAYEKYFSKLDQKLHESVKSRRANAIPLKFGLCLYALLNAAKENIDLLNCIKKNLEPLPPEMTHESEGWNYEDNGLRIWVRWLGKGEGADFDDSLIPVPTDYNDGGRNGWAHHLRQVLLKSILKGAPEYREVLLGAGDKMVFDDDRIFENLRWLGEHHFEGLSPKVYGELLAGTKKTNYTTSWVGLKKQAELDKFYTRYIQELSD